MCVEGEPKQSTEASRGKAWAATALQGAALRDVFTVPEAEWRQVGHAHTHTLTRLFTCAYARDSLTTALLSSGPQRTRTVAAGTREQK